MSDPFLTSTDKASQPNLVNEMNQTTETNDVQAISEQGAANDQRLNRVTIQDSC